MIPEKEKLYLRDLAKELKEISQTDANNLKRKKWYDINNLKQNSFRKILLCVIIQKPASMNYS